MNILAIEYSLATSSLDIYVSGCKRHCYGCQNPETWDFDQGEYYKKYREKISQYILKYNSLIKNIMIFGGEPLNQDLKKLEDFLLFLNKNNISLWLFTSYNFDQLPHFIFKYCDYIKCGEYLEELKTNNHIQYGIKLATSNQNIYKKELDY